MPYTIDNLDNLTVRAADRTTPTVIDGDVAMFPALANFSGRSVVVTGLTAGDSIGFSGSSAFVVNNSVLSWQGFSVGTISTGPGFFRVDFGQSSVLTAQVVEYLLEALTFSTTGAATTSTRTLEITVSTDDTPVTGSVQIDVVDPGFDLSGLDGRTVPVGATGAQALLDGAVAFTATTATFLGGSVALDGLAAGDVAGIVSGPGSRFSVVNGTLFDAVGGSPVAIGTVETTATRLAVTFTDAVSAAQIDALIQSLTVTVQETATRTLSVTVTDSTGTTDTQSATFSFVPGIDGLPDVLRIDNTQTLNPVALIADASNIPPLLYDGGTITVEGLLTGDVVEVAFNSGFGIDFISLEILDGTTPIGTFEQTGSGGTETFRIHLSSLVQIPPATVERLLEALRFMTTSSTVSRDLTITVSTAGPTALVDTVSVVLSPPLSLSDLASEVLIDPAAATTPTLIDSAVSVDALPGARIGTLSVSGLAAGDAIWVDTSGAGRFAIGTDAESGMRFLTDLNNGQSIAEVFFSAVEVRFEFITSASPDVVEALIEALTFRSIAASPAETRTLTVSINDTVSQSVDIHLVPDGAVQLFGVTAAAQFGGVTIATQPQLLDSDVSVRVNGLETLGASVTVSGLVAGDAVTLRLAGDGAGQFSADGQTLRYEGAAIGTYVPGDADGALAVQFTATVPAAVIEAVIENLLFSHTGTTPRPAAPVTISVVDAGGQTVASSAVAIGIAPELATLRDVVGIELAQAGSGVNLDTSVSIPVGDPPSTFGGSLTITGLAAGDEIGLRTPPQTNVYLSGNALMLGSAQIGTVTRSDGTVVFAFANGTGRGNVETVLSGLTLRSTADAPAPSRDLVFTLVNGAGLMVAQDRMTVNVGDAAFADVATALTVRLSTPATLIDSDISLDIPAGLDFAGLRLQMTGLTGTGDTLSLVTGGGGPITLSGGNVLYNGVTVGTVSGGTTTTVGQQVTEQPLQVTLNASATAAAVAAIAESIGYAGGLTTPTGVRNLSLSLVAPGNFVLAQAAIAMTVSPPPLGGLDDAVTYTLDSGLMRIDGTIDELPLRAYNDARITISGLEANDVIAFMPENQLFFTTQSNGDKLIVGITDEGNYVAGRWDSTADSLTILLGSETNNGTIRAMIQALGFQTSNADPQRDLTITVADGPLVIATDQITVNVQLPQAGLNDLSQSLTLTPTEAATPQLLDADVTLDAPLRAFNGGTLEVSGLDTGDVVGLRTTGGSPFSIAGPVLMRDGIPIGLVATTPSGSFQITLSTGTHTAAQMERLIENLTFSTASGAAVSRTLTITATTSAGEAISDTIVVNVARPPVIADLVPVLRIATGDAATLRAIDSAVTLTAPDSNFEGGTLVVSGAANGDEIGFIQSDTGFGIITRPDGSSGLGYFAEALDVGDITLTADGFTVTFGAEVTATAIEALIENISFSHDGILPPAQTRDITVTLTDGFGGTATRTIRIDVLDPGARALDYVILDGGSDPAPVTIPGVQTTGVALDLAAGDLFPANQAPDSFVVSYSGLFDFSPADIGSRALIGWAHAPGMVLRVNGVEVGNGAAGSAILNLSAGLHRIEVLLSHSASGGAVTGAAPTLTIGNVLPGDDGPVPLDTPVDLLTMARTTPAMIYRVEGNVRVTQSFAVDFPQLFHVTDPGDVAAAMSRVVQSLMPPPGSQVTTTETVIPVRIGTAADDTLSGLAGQNIEIEGGYGNDLILAGAGRDRMDGGAGADTLSYAASAAGVTMNLGTGIGSGGDAEGDIALSFARLIGSAQADSLTGADVAETIMGGEGADIIAGAGGDDSMRGDDGGDTLSGGAGNDTLDGGAGDDAMDGGAGNDLFLVDSAADTVTEAAGQGTDTVRSRIATYTLGDHVERLELLGTAVTANGNALANTLVGNALANTLNGGAGNDYMAGGAGNDIYVVGAAVDIVAEAAGGGTDTVRSWIGTYRLGDHVERLELQGAAVQGIGNALGNTIVGTTAANTLQGAAGNDFIAGGRGSDQLYGGLGADVFVYLGVQESQAGVATRDIIHDFDAQDRINLAEIDANGAAEGKGTFAWRGTGAFSGAAGELRYAVFGSNTIVEADLDGDRAADMQILLRNVTALGADDFFL